MKKIALISTFCDTQEKIDILVNNIKKVKSLNIDTLVISPIPLCEEIIRQSDYVFFTKENPLLSWPIRDFTFWKIIPYENTFIKMHRNIEDYGWASLNQVKRLSQIALNYEYDIFYHMIYDLEIDEVVRDELISNKVNLFYSRIDPNNLKHVWETTLHFMIFDRKMMESIEKEITLENYLSTNGVAEDEVLKWKKKYNIPISSHMVTDKIYYWKDYDFFNYSKDKNYKLFLNKHEDSEIWKNNPPIMSILDSKIRIVFYDILYPKTIKININSLEYNFWVDKNLYIELNVDSLNIKHLVIDGFDYTQEYTNIKKNISYIEDEKV